MHLNDIGKESLETSFLKGFDTVTPDDWIADPAHMYKVPTKLVLVHCEVSEAVEEFRKQHRLDHFGSELADVIIRIGQLVVVAVLPVLDEQVAVPGAFTVRTL